MAATTILNAPLSSASDRPTIPFCTKSNWGDTFTSFTLDHQGQENYAEAIEALKEEARRMLLAKGKKCSEKLVLIDLLERLGVAYHFDPQIEELLEDMLKLDDSVEDHDLFTTSLRFRLMRQHRHYVSCSVFEKFKGKDGKFKETLNSDAKGLLSLYEAVYLRIHGEEILDEAEAFTIHHLKRMVQQLESPLQDQVKRALERPLHRGIPRIETRYFISSYEKDSTKDELLLKFAKLDFNYVQNTYKEDLGHLTRWWKELSPNLPYARDRVVEDYVWASSYRFEPQYSDVRVFVTKSIQMLTVLDDTYDSYATVEEGDLFAEVFERWDINEIDQLPDYMKLIYRCILRMYDDYEHEAAKQGKPWAVPYSKHAVEEIVRADNQGLKYIVGKEILSFEDYIANTMITSCAYATCAWSIPGTKPMCEDSIHWLMSKPKSVEAAAKLCRFMDDLGSYDRESQHGELLTGLDFYMKQHGVSLQEAKDKFVELTEDAWKELNAEWILLKNSTPKHMMAHVMGYARSADVFYRNCNDGYAKPEMMAPQIVHVFLDPIII